MEERARKQMESYARELSIRYAHSDDNDTLKRLKTYSNELLDENKKLDKEKQTLKVKLQRTQQSLTPEYQQSNKDLTTDVEKLKRENLNLKDTLACSESGDLLQKFELSKQRENKLEDRIRQLKREIEKMKIRYE